MKPAFSLDEYILHHLVDGQEWHLPFLPPIHIPAPLTLHTLMMILASVFLIIIFCFLYDKKARVPRGLTNFLEAIIIFIRDRICVPYLGHEDGHKLTPLFATFFFFILMMNVMGLIPIFATATANVNVTAGLALITLSFMFFAAILKNGLLGFCKAFMPTGVPWPILILLFPIEFLGMFIKTFALTIRLFANMLAGHLVILSVLGVVTMFGLVAMPAVILALGIYLLEVMVAFLQAFIFTLLSAMFVGQTMHPEH